MEIQEGADPKTTLVRAKWDDGSEYDIPGLTHYEKSWKDENVKEKEKTGDVEIAWECGGKEAFTCA